MQQPPASHCCSVYATAYVLVTLERDRPSDRAGEYREAINYLDRLLWTTTTHNPASQKDVWWALKQLLVGRCALKRNGLVSRELSSATRCSVHDGCICDGGVASTSLHMLLDYCADIDVNVLDCMSGKRSVTYGYTFLNDQHQQASHPTHIVLPEQLANWSTDRVVYVIVNLVEPKHYVVCRLRHHTGRVFSLWMIYDPAYGIQQTKPMDLSRDNVHTAIFVKLARQRASGN